MLPIFKVGDTFTVPIQFINSDTKEPIVITSDMQFSCAILDARGNTVTTPTVEPLPEDGYLLISELDTSQWATGIATLDIKLVQGDGVRHSQDFRVS